MLRDLHSCLYSTVRSQRAETEFSIKREGTKDVTVNGLIYLSEKDVPWNKDRSVLNFDVHNLAWRLINVELILASRPDWLLSSLYIWNLNDLPNRHAPYAPYGTSLRLLFLLAARISSEDCLVGSVVVSRTTSFGPFNGCPLSFHKGFYSKDTCSSNLAFNWPREPILCRRSCYHAPRGASSRLAPLCVVSMTAIKSACFVAWALLKGEGAQLPRCSG